MDLITGLLLLWGVGKAQVGPGHVPPIHTEPTPHWPAPVSPPPARPVKRRPAKVRPAPRRVVRKTGPVPVPAVPAAPPPPPPMPAMPATVEPVAPPPPVYTSLAVQDVQDVLNGLGAKLKRDNLFGPKTAGAWKSAALKRDLPAHIVRMAPQVVQVTTYTLDRLRSASGAVSGLYIP